jgi:hypothetical protein
MGCQLDFGLRMEFKIVEQSLQEIYVLTWHPIARVIVYNVTWLRFWNQFFNVYKLNHTKVMVILKFTYDETYNCVHVIWWHMSNA